MGYCAASSMQSFDQKPKSCVEWEGSERSPCCLSLWLLQQSQEEYIPLPSFLFACTSLHLSWKEPYTSQPHIHQISKSKNNGCTILLSLICEALLLHRIFRLEPRLCRRQHGRGWGNSSLFVHLGACRAPHTKNNGNHCIRQLFDLGLDLKSWISMCEQCESHIFANTSINLQLGPVCWYCTLCHTSFGSMFKPKRLIAVWDSQQMNNPLHRQATFITSCATRFRSIRAVLRRLLELWLSPVSFSLATLRRFSGNMSGNWQVQTSIHKDI